MGQTSWKQAFFNNSKWKGWNLHYGEANVCSLNYTTVYRISLSYNFVLKTKKTNVSMTATKYACI